MGFRGRIEDKLYLADALTPLGGYPGNEEVGKTMQAKRKPEEISGDFVAAAQWVQQHTGCDGKPRRRGVLALVG